MKFKNVYDLIKKLWGGKKMVKEVKRLVRLSKKEDIKMRTKSKEQKLKDLIVQYSVRIGFECNAIDFNKAVGKLFKDIDKLGLFKKDKNA